jgi:hypothetical protein
VGGVLSGAAAFIAIEQMNYLQKYPNIRFSQEMFNNSLNNFRGFHPRCFVLTPDTITPEQVIHHHRDQRWGGLGGHALSPPS